MTIDKETKASLATAEPSAESPRSTPIRICLRVENRLLHQALLHIFRKHRGFRIVEEDWANDARASSLLHSNCDVLIGSGSPELLLSALALDSFRDPAFKVVLIGMEADEEQFLAAVSFGVNGYLLKDASASDVVAAVRAVSRGEAVCPPELSSALFRYAAKGASESLSGAAAKPHLTARQRQLAALAAKGLTDKEIASQLKLSSYTVRNHILRMVKQLDARNREEAVETIRGSGHAVTA